MQNKNTKNIFCIVIAFLFILLALLPTYTSDYTI